MNHTRELFWEKNNLIHY